MRSWHGNRKKTIAMFLVTSPIVIYVPARGLLAVEIMHAIVQWLANFNIKSKNDVNVCKWETSLYDQWAEQYHFSLWYLLCYWALDSYIFTLTLHNLVHHLYQLHKCLNLSSLWIFFGDQSYIRHSIAYNCIHIYCIVGYFMFKIVIPSASASDQNLVSLIVKPTHCWRACT